MVAAWPRQCPHVAVLDDPGAALAALDPMRASLLAALAAEPASAAAVAARLGLPRQKVGYHLNAPSPSTGSSSRSSSAATAA